MGKAREISLDRIVSFLTNGGSLDEKEFSFFKKSEYCKRVINIGRGNKVIILNKPIGEMYEVTIYYHPKNKHFPYSSLP